MAILIRCKKCKTEMKLSAKKCKKCQSTIPAKGRLYKVIVRCKGRKVTRTATNLELARDIEGKLKVDIARGEYDLQKKKPAITINELWKKYLPWIKVNKKTWKNDENYYKKHLQPAFGGKRLDAISQFDIEKFIIKMKKNKSKRGTPYALATIKHQLIILTRLYSIAEKWGIYTGDNPCRRVKKPRLNNKVTEYLEDDVLTNLLKALDEWENKMSVSIVLFSLCTGIRRGELFKLTWGDVDLKRGTMILTDPKGKQDQTLPLSNKAMEVLKNVPMEYDTKWIFYGRAGRQRSTFQNEWSEIKKKADLPSKFRFHGLRHHFASSLVSAGVSLYTVQNLLCHKDAAMTQRYADLADKTLRAAVNLSDDLLETKSKSEVVNQGDHKNGK